MRYTVIVPAGVKKYGNGCGQRHVQFWKEVECVMRKRKRIANPYAPDEQRCKLHRMKAKMACVFAVLLTGCTLVGCGGQAATPATTAAQVYETAPIETNKTAVSTVATQPETRAVETVPETRAVETVPETKAVETVPETKATKAASMEYRNALRSAENYLQFTAFSYEGLIEQLEYEDYPREAAVYAADNCGADWSTQALKSARNYLSFTAFSYNGLIKQLEYEKYTTEQATYAADNCGADWNEQAALSAENYLSFTPFSRSGLINQLVYEGFTKEQAEYGAEANGY